MYKGCLPLKRLFLVSEARWRWGVRKLLKCSGKRSFQNWGIAECVGSFHIYIYFYIWPAGSEVEWKPREQPWKKCESPMEMKRSSSMAHFISWKILKVTGSQIWYLLAWLPMSFFNHYIFLRLNRNGWKQKGCQHDSFLDFYCWLCWMKLEVGWLYHCFQSQRGLLALKWIFHSIHNEP